MATATPKCAKCSGRMSPGFLLDFTSDDLRRDQALWVAGERERSGWVGTKLSGRDVREVDAFRCESCGYLEFYAQRQRKDYIV